MQGNIPQRKHGELVISEHGIAFVSTQDVETDRKASTNNIIQHKYPKSGKPKRDDDYYWTCPLLLR